MTTHTDDKINRAADTVVDKAQVVADQAGRKVSETAGVVKEQAKRTVSQVSEQAKTNVSTRMGDVASELGSVAEAVRQTSEDLGDQPGIARYGNRIADQIEGVSSYLNDHGVEEVLMDAENLARRQPALFLGGAFMLGLVVGRFLRSSGQQVGYQSGGPRGYQDYPSSGYQSGGYQSGNYQGSGYGGSTTQSSSRSTRQSSRPSVEMGAETGANESSYRQGPSVYNTSNNEEFGDNPTAYPTGLAEE